MVNHLSRQLIFKHSTDIKLRYFATAKTRAEALPPGNGSLGVLDSNSHIEETGVDAVKLYSPIATRCANYINMSGDLRHKAKGLLVKVMETNADAVSSHVACTQQLFNRITFDAYVVRTFLKRISMGRPGSWNSDA